MNDSLPLLLVLGLAATHVLAGRLRFLDKIPRSRWLSAAGGVSVAYVFVHLLPDLAEYQRHVEQVPQAWVRALDRHVYVFALVGLVLFYGLEKFAKAGGGGRNEAGPAPPAVFWVHVASFGVYNAVIGYLLTQEDRSLGGRLLFALAMAPHFVVNDFGLREHHKHLYQAFGRWVLAAAVLVGWAVAAFLPEVPKGTMATAFALLAGAIVLNVLKEELPEERQSRYWSFVLGAAGYGAILLFV